MFRSLTCSFLATAAIGLAARAFGADAAPAATPGDGVTPIAYEAPADGFVSLHLSDAGGAVVRELLHAAPRKKGPNVETWDGLDERGQPVPPGQYTWKFLHTQGLKAEYLLSLGINPKPDWDGWPGNHRAVCSLAADAQGLYVLNDGGEGGGMAVKIAWGDEKRLWKIPHWYEVWCGMISAGLLDGQLYMLQRNQKVYRADAATGERNAGPWDVSMADDVKLAAYSCAYQVTDLDAAAGQVVLSYARHDKLRWLNPQDGKVIDEAAVPEPYGVAAGGDGQVYVLSGDRVLELSRQDKTPREVVPAGQISAGFRLALDAASGDLLVAENRKMRAEARTMYWKDQYPLANAAVGQQVKRFSKAGKLLATYGRAEGRRFGLYEPQDFDNIVDIVTTPDGGFVICESESPPRRTAVFGRDGKLRREWYGAQMYGNWCQPDVTDPTNVWFSSSFDGIVHAKVDYARRTWTVRATYSYGDMKDWFGMSGVELRPLRRNGQTYLASVGRWPLIYRVDEPGRRLVPLVFADPNIGNSWKQLNLPPATHQIFQELVGDRRERSLIWTRPDGDVAAPRAQDMRVSDWWNWTFGWNVDNDFAYTFESKHTDEVRNLYRLAPVAWTKDGAPVYDFDKRQPLACDLGRSETNHPRNPNHPCEPAGVMPDGCGNLFAAYDTDMQTKPFGQGFWSNRSGYNKIAKWDKAGKLRWAVGRHSAVQDPAPGEAKYLWRITGVVGGCVVVNDMDNGMQHVWDSDGLWVGRLLDHPVEGGAAPASAYRLHGGENFGGSLFEVTDAVPVPGCKTGDVLFFLSTNCNPVYRITGWDQFVRGSGEVVVTQAAAARLAAAAQADPAVRIARLDSIKIDGDLAEWAKLAPLTIRDGTQARARVWLAWDAANLYAAFDVETDAPWKSAASEQNAFQGGAEVDICVGPAGERDRPGPGDTRCVVAPIQGRTRVVEFMPVLAEGLDRSQRQPATYQTLNGKITFDRVAMLEEARTAAKPRPDGHGYTVELAIPLRAPLQLRPGQRLRFDAACTIADAEGARAVARFPWHSKAAEDQMIHDNFVEAQLRPQHWGSAVLE